MGILPSHAESVAHHHDHGHEEPPTPGSSSHDAHHQWHFVEETLVNPTTGLLKIPVLSVLFMVALPCSLLAVVHQLREEFFRRVDRQLFERTLNWVPDWHFVRRAVASPRAPAIVA